MSRNCMSLKENTRIPDTMLTIVGPENPPYWRTVICRCECGKVVVLPYQKVYQASRFSCGCAKRVRADAMDATGLTVFSPTGNKDEQARPDPDGRRLTVMCRDEPTLRWWYLCHCCGELFLLPGGMSHGIEATLRRIADETCPNYRRFYAAPYDRRQGYWPVELGDLCAKVGLGMTLMPDEIVRYYKDPDKNVVRDKFGFIEGFRGLPDSDEFKELEARYKESVVRRREAEQAKFIKKTDAYWPKYENGVRLPWKEPEGPELPHEDEFAEADY